MYIKNVTADDFYTQNNFKSQIDFVYDNKNYNCKCKKLDKFSLNVYDENKNFDFIDDINKDIINLIIYDMKNFIGLEISENDMLNIISSQPRR